MFGAAIKSKYKPTYITERLCADYISEHIGAIADQSHENENYGKIKPIAYVNEILMCEL